MTTLVRSVPSFFCLVSIERSQLSLQELTSSWGIFCYWTSFFFTLENAVSGAPSTLFSFSSYSLSRMISWSLLQQFKASTFNPQGKQPMMRVVFLPILNATNKCDCHGRITQLLPPKWSYLVALYHATSCPLFWSWSAFSFWWPLWMLATLCLIFWCLTFSPILSSTVHYSFSIY